MGMNTWSPAWRPQRGRIKRPTSIRSSARRRTRDLAFQFAWVIGAGVVGLLHAGGAAAAGGGPTDRPSPAEVLDYQEETWKELDPGLPPAPAESNLFALHSYDLDGAITIFLDKASISLAPDQVFRYTAVLRSDLGVSNVLHEGIRCDSNQVKTFGYFDGGEFHPSRNPTWEKIQPTGPTAYRAVLVDEYVCRRSTKPHPFDDIYARLLRNADERNRQIDRYRKDRLFQDVDRASDRDND